MSDKLPKIGLGLTLLQQVDSFVMMRWVELLRSHYWPGPVLNGRRAYVSMARNIIIDEFFQRDEHPHPWDDWQPGELEGLLFWDSDQLPTMVIPQWDGSFKILTRHIQDLIVEHPEVECFGGLYFSRETDFVKNAADQIVKFPHEPVAYERLPDPRWGHGYRYLSWERMKNEILSLEGRFKLHKVGGVGTGAMFIRKSLLQRMATGKQAGAMTEAMRYQRAAQLAGDDAEISDWLQIKADAMKQRASAPMPIFENPDLQDGRTWTEDLHFCEQVQNLDPPGEIWLDAANESAHLGDRIWIRSQHYLAAHGEIGLRADSAMALEKAASQATSSKIILPDGWKN